MYISVVAFLTASS